MMKKIILSISLLLLIVLLAGCSSDFNLNKKDKLKNVYFSELSINNDLNHLDRISVFGSSIDSFKSDNGNSYIVIKNDNGYGLLDANGNEILECEYYDSNFHVYGDYIVARYKTNLVDECKIIKMSEKKEVVSKKYIDVKYFNNGLVCINGITYDLNGSATEILGDKNLSSISINSCDDVIVMGKYKVLIDGRSILVLNKKNKYVNKYQLDDNYNIFALRKNNLLLQKIEENNNDYSYIKDSKKYKLKTYLLNIKSGDKKSIKFDMVVDNVKHYNNDSNHKYGRKVNKGNICYGYPIISNTLGEGIYTLYNNKMSLIHNYDKYVASKVSKKLYFDGNKLTNKRGKTIVKCDNVYNANDYVITTTDKIISLYNYKGKLYDSIEASFISSSNNKICYMVGNKYYIYDINSKSKVELDNNYSIKGNILIYKMEADYYRYYNLNKDLLINSLANDFLEYTNGDSKYLCVNGIYYKKG